MKKTLTVKEVAEYIGVHQDTIYRMVREGEMPHFRVRSRIMFDKDSIDSWKSNRVINGYSNNEVLTQNNSPIFDEDINEWIQFAYYLKKNDFQLGKIENLVRNIINTIKF